MAKSPTKPAARPKATAKLLGILREAEREVRLHQHLSKEALEERCGALSKALKITPPQFNAKGEGDRWKTLTWAGAEAESESVKNLWPNWQAAAQRRLGEMAQELE